MTKALATAASLVMVLGSPKKCSTADGGHSRFLEAEPGSLEPEKEARRENELVLQRVSVKSSTRHVFFHSTALRDNAEPDC